MRKFNLLLLLLTALSFAMPMHAQTGVVVIGHAGIDKIDAVLVQRIYTGKVIEVGGVMVTPVNASMGTVVRTKFLQAYLNQDDDKYVAYWTVRRYIGKGVPPKEFSSTAEVIRFVQATPGAIGYIEEASLTPGLNVVSR